MSFLITSTEAREFTVIWSPPDPFLQYGVITGYLLTCNDSETNMVAPSFPRLLITSPTIVDELRPFTSYNCSLVAVNSAGVSKAVTYSAMTEPDGKLYVCGIVILEEFSLQTVVFRNSILVSKIQYTRNCCIYLVHCWSVFSVISTSFDACFFLCMDL